MRAVYAILLCAFFCPFLSAHADVIFSGVVSTFTFDGSMGTSGPQCGHSGSGIGSLDLQCSTPQPPRLATATVNGSGDAFIGSLFVNADASLPPFTMAVANGSLDLNGGYILAGGSGVGTLNVVVDSQRFGLGNYPSESCTITVNGVSQACDLSGQDMVFSVNYGVPFSIGLDLDIDALAQNGEDTDDIVTYSFEGTGLTSTPEPSSILLLMPGLASAIFVARSRRGSR